MHRSFAENTFLLFLDTYLDELNDVLLEQDLRDNPDISLLMLSFLFFVSFKHFYKTVSLSGIQTQMITIEGDY